MTRRVVGTVIMALLSGLGACASDPIETTLRIDASDYHAAFDASKDVLRDTQFELDRIDARHGVITTLPQISAGYATPWRPVARTATQSTEDLLNDQRRLVRLTFEADDPTVADLTEPESGTLTLVVDVTLERRYRPGRRVSPVAGNRSSFTRDPQLVRRGMQPNYTVAISRDDALASVILKRIASALPARSGRDAD